MVDMARGVYEKLVTREWDENLSLLDPELIQRARLDPADAHEALTRHVAALTRRALRSVGGDRTTALATQITLANRIAAAIAAVAPQATDGRDAIVTTADELLLAIADRSGLPGPVRFPPRPASPLSTSALLVNGRDQPRIGPEIASELASADAVDLLCAFVRWHGLRILERAIGEFTARGGRLRVITTTYRGVTERRALDRLVALGARVKVCYETRTTRLHAKAWLLRRNTGFWTAYVGSSNLSRSALLDGLEWNVRLSSVDQPHLLDTFAATFDEYWVDPAFEEYRPDRDRARLDTALGSERGGGADLPLDTVTPLEVRPFGYQREVLDELSAEREVHGRWRNLVVMATGTGKTVVAALDYRRLRDGDTPVDSLLFVAHREEILRQSLATFRHVLRRGDFGELLVGGSQPEQWQHVFASVQSLARVDLDHLDPRRFDMVIIDEFHHAMAPTYGRLLNHVRPRVLLGLTATPERADGQDVRVWFGGRTATQLRLWEALERGLLSPFHYFGVHDEVSLSGLRWRRGQGYDTAELSKLYTGHEARVRLILTALHDKITDVSRMKAIGFCVSIDHAEFMARRFSEVGIPARAVTARTGRDERERALAGLRDGRVGALFTVDLFNEGVDLPEIDTVLLLRPTESATVFLQQIGRGLRLADGKACLTVLDFVGAQHARFRFDLRYRALTGATRRGLVREVERGFPNLPAGCHIELDRVASRLVLDNVRRSLQVSWPELAAELRRLGDCSLGDFLHETGLDPEDLYRRARGGWTDLRRRAGLELRAAGPDDDRLGRAIGRMLHVDDPDRLAFLRDVSGRPTPPAMADLDERGRRLAAMLHFALWGAGEPPSDLEASLLRFWRHAGRRTELFDLSSVLEERIRRVTSLPTGLPVPLRRHARYTRDEALAAFGHGNPSAVRQGVLWLPEARADLFFVTLRKTEAHYSPTTMYQDRAITPELFQWESQSTTPARSPTGHRYVHHRERGSSVHLFVRESRERDGDLGAPPYLYAGTMAYVSHVGDRPMRIVWRLDTPLPADVFHAAKVAGG